MLRPCCRITIGNVKLITIAEVELEESWKDLTSTGTITIPKRLTVDGKPLVDGVKAIFKPGDAVSVELGYYPNFVKVFTGYVRDVAPTVPVRILVEDAMYLLKRQTYQKTFEQVTVKQLVDFLLTRVKQPIKVVYSFPGLQLGKFRIGRGSTGTDILEELRKTYGIYSFFREDVLYVGFRYTHSDQVKSYQRTLPFTFSETIIEDELTFKSLDNSNIKVVAASLLADNKSFDYEVGKSDGTQVPLFFYHLSKADLAKVAKAAYDRYNVAGFTGSFTTFGTPLVRQGDVVKLHDHKVKDRNGRYLVQRVVRRFGVDTGYRQEIFLEHKVS